MASLQKNVASQNFTFCLVSATTGAGVAGASVSGFVTKDAGAQASTGGTVTNQGNGQYNYAPTQAETNATDIGFLFTATGCVPVNADFHTDQVDANGMLKVDVEDWKGTAVGSPATAGIPDVNTKNINNVSTGSVTTINANIGETQPINFTGTGASALVQSDMKDIAGSAVSTSSAQIGVNVVNVAGAAAAIDSNNRMKVDVDSWNGTTVAALPGNFSAFSIDSNGNVSTTSNIKKNTAQAGFTFLMTDSTNHNPVTGKTVTATRSLDGNAFASCANAVSEVGSGTYTISLAATDTNANHIMLRFTSAGCDDLNVSVITQP